MEAVMENAAVEEFSKQRLMDDVRQYSCLYDKYCRDYQDKNAKNNAWAAVAAKYGITPLEAEKKYKTIRSSYTRFLKKKRNAPPGSRSAEAPTPLAFQNLDWLASHIDHKETSLRWEPATKGDGYLSEFSSLNGDDVYHSSYGELVKEEVHANGVHSEVQSASEREPASSERGPSQAIQAAGSTTTAPVMERSITVYYDKPKACQVEGNGGETVVNLNGNLEPAHSQYVAESSSKRKRVEPEDEDELFCLSLVANLKRLTPRSKAIAKMRFQQALFDLEFPDNHTED